MSGRGIDSFCHQNEGSQGSCSLTGKQKEFDTCLQPLKSTPDKREIADSDTVNLASSISSSGDKKFKP
jgi:hypothetical protein